METAGSAGQIGHAPRGSGGSLSGPAVAKLQAALSDARAGRSMLSPDIKEAVRSVCDEARREQWPPETLLVAYKSALETVGAVRGLPRGPERDAVIARLVSLCINEYYGAPQPGMQGSARSGHGE
jgi:hypothetical protein